MREKGTEGAVKERKMQVESVGDKKNAGSKG